MNTGFKIHNIKIFKEDNGQEGEVGMGAPNWNAERISKATLWGMRVCQLNM